jgi:DNA gyrase subunit A
VIAMRVTEKTGPLVGCAKVLEGDEVLVITQNGMVIRTPSDSLREMGRATQGVRLINLKPGDTVSAIEVISGEQDDALDQVLI